MSIVIHTDGSCHGNPGPGGYAAIIQSAEGIHKVGGEATYDPNGPRHAHPTNNRMELMAAIVALEYLPDRAQVTLYSDSKYLTENIARVPSWAKKSWTNTAGPVKNKDLWERLLRAQMGKQVEYRWVKGHNGDPLNEEADTLANRMAERAASSPHDFSVDGPHQLDHTNSPANRSPQGTSSPMSMPQPHEHPITQRAISLARLAQEVQEQAQLHYEFEVKVRALIQTSGDPVDLLEQVSQALDHLDRERAR